MRLSGIHTRTARLSALAGVVLFVAGVVWVIHRDSIGSAGAASPAGPPWIFGQARARFTLIAYSDLECSYCRQYLPTLQRLIAEHPEANLQWHHLPLAVHEPAALQAARLAECAGEVKGGSGFWAAVDWLYGHPASHNSGLRNSISLPLMTPGIEACLRSARPETIIAREVTEAKRDQVSETPTLRILDHESGRSLMLRGVFEPDALLSAMDFLASRSTGEIDAK